MSDHDALARKSARLHLAMEAEETLRRIEEFPENPTAMAYFYDLFRRLYTGEPVLPDKKQIIGTMCVQVPDELVYAAGAVPFRLCSGAHSYDQAGADFMPAKSCPVVRATCGMLRVNESLWGDRMRAVVIPTTCDQKKKAAAMMDNLAYTIYTLEMPPGKDSEMSRYFWQESVKRFALDLQKMTGRKITRKGIEKAIRKKAEATRLFRRLYELKKADPALFFGKDLLLVANAYFVDDIDRWTEAARILIDEIEERRGGDFCAGNRKAPRLLLTGSPPVFPNIKLPLLIEQSGGMLVADEVCSSSRLLYDSVAYAEASLDDMIPAVADRYLKPCTCPCLTPNSDRLRKLAEMIGSFAVDGVVYQAFTGCMPYEMEHHQVSRFLEEKGVPMLYVETDYSPEDHGQLATRVEAFIESIRFRKRKHVRLNTGTAKREDHGLLCRN